MGGHIPSMLSTCPLSLYLVPTAVVTVISVMPACPANLLVTWSPLTLDQLHAPAENSSYVVSYSSETGGGAVMVPYSLLVGMVSAKGEFVGVAKCI